jgi:ATP-binding cassette, subfamily B, bacterial MsbA
MGQVMGKPTQKELGSTKIYFRLLKYVIPYWKTLGLSVLCAIFYSIFSGLSIYVIIPLLDTLFSGKSFFVVPSMAQTDIFSTLKSSLNGTLNYFIVSGNPMDSLFKICLLVLIGFLLRNFFAYFQSFTMANVEQGLIMNLRNALFKHLHNLDISYFSSERSGNLISRVTNDVNVVNNVVSATFLNLIREPISIIIYLTLAIALSWEMTLYSLAAFPVTILVISLIGLKIHKQSGILQERMADITSVLQETIFGAKIVRAFSMEKFENNRFFSVTKKYFRTAIKISRIRNLSTPSAEFLGTLSAMVIIWYGGRLVLVDKTLSSSEFLGFFMIIFQIMTPVKELSTVQNRIQEATAAGRRIFDILDIEPEIQNAPNAVELKEFKESIEFKNVSFSYKNGNEDNPVYVLKNINLKIKSGEILAIVGPSGAGKSTLIDLIPRFYDPTEGTITIDNLNLKDLNLKSLREKIGIVTQETILFNETIRNNIAYGLDNYAEDKIIEAAKAANAHKFILESAEGYNTIIGERGLKLSGGQRQRLSIARALLKNPPVMIFDEATSALDSESEILVQEAIERLMHNRTSFVIAHRLSTIRNSDRILVIDKGEIVQAGSHDDLIKIDGLYKKLYDMQFQL